MRIVNLGSGSKGNSTFVEYNGTKLLIDVGFGEKKLSEKLAEIGETLKNISAVLITHEHTDHIAGLKILAKKYEMDFYIETPLAESGCLSAVFKPEKLHKIDTLPFEIGEICVRAFKISHDAICPVGFVLNAKKSKSKVAFLTDVGVVDDEIISAVSGVKMIFIESNYDEDMLFSGYYPESVKYRIASAFGHLSNKESLELAKKLQKFGTKCFILSHISENNNTEELAYLNYVEYFSKLGLTLDKDIFIRLSYQNKLGNNFTLKEEFDGV